MRLKLIAVIFYLYYGKAEMNSEIDNTLTNEDEIDAIILGNKLNTTRNIKNEQIVEKFVESLISSQKYLKSIEKRINHLDKTMHTNFKDILNYLSEIKAKPQEELTTALNSLKNELAKLKVGIVERVHKLPKYRDNASSASRKLKTMRSTTLCFSIFITMICILASCEAVKKKKHGKKNPDSVYWKNDYEEELSKAAISNEKDEKSHNFAKSNSEDTLMEKIVDSLSSSEEFLKKINSIEIKLTRLDAELHERTDDIRKQLAQVLKKFNEMPDLKNLETALDHFQSNKVKANENYEASDTNVDVRLNGIERSLQSIASMVSVNKKHQFGIHNKLDNCGDTEVMSLMRQFQRNMFINKGNCDCKDSRVDRSESFPADCNEIQMQGFNISGIYKIKPEESHAFYVLCDLSSPGGGWTVLQNRFDGTQDFYKPWSDYQNGFGNLAGEFWLGLDKIHQLTTQKLYSLRIELESAQGIESFASYSVFSVGPEIEGFRISALGNYYGNAGDSLSYHAGQRFSTWDSDNDDWKDGSCAQKHGGAWWYKECAKSNLNGYYTNNEGDTTQMASMFWTPIDRSGYLTKVKIMIRPLPATHPKTHSYYSNSQKSKLTRPHHPGTSHMHYRDENLSSNNFFN